MEASSGWHQREREDLHLIGTLCQSQPHLEITRLVSPIEGKPRSTALIKKEGRRLWLNDDLHKPLFKSLMRRQKNQTTRSPTDRPTNANRPFGRGDRSKEDRRQILVQLGRPLTNSRCSDPGAYYLELQSGKIVPRTWNATHLKFYYC